MFSPPPPPIPVTEVRGADQITGSGLNVGGITSKGAWQWIGRDQTSPLELWIPLDLLIGRLGFQRVGGGGDNATLEWFGHRAALATLAKRSLDDEVAIDAAPWFKRVNATTSRRDGVLSIALKAPRLQGLRQGRGSTAGRLVLDLSGPALMQRQNDDLLLGVSITAAQEVQFLLLRHLQQARIRSRALRTLLCNITTQKCVF